MIKPCSVLVISFFIALLGCEDRNYSAAETLLIGVADDFKLLEALKAKGVSDKGVTLSFDSKFLQKLILIRSASLDIQDMDAKNLEALCLLSNYATETGFSELVKDDPELTEIAVNFALAISPEIQSEIRQAQKTLDGKGCKIALSNT